MSPYAPKVSVHVVTYQQVALLSETLDGLVNQNFDDLQIVVSDDGSTDGTAELARTYASTYPGRVVALTDGPNLGISGNSNRCLRACTGEFVAFVAGDDIALPGKVAAQVAWLEADPRRVFCYHDMEHFDSDTGRRICLHSEITRQRAGAGPKTFLTQGYCSATSSIMVRRSAIPERGFDERLRVYSDWKFAVDCLIGGGIFGPVPGVLGRYRRHAKNATRLWPELQWQEKHLGLAAIEADHPELAELCARARAYAYLQRGVAHLQRGDAHEARIHLKNAWRHSARLPAKAAAWLALAYTPRAAMPEPLARRIFR